MNVSPPCGTPGNFAAPLVSAFFKARFIADLLAPDLSSATMRRVSGSHFVVIWVSDSEVISDIGSSMVDLVVIFFRHSSGYDL